MLSFPGKPLDIAVRVSFTEGVDRVALELFHETRGRQNFVPMFTEGGTKSSPPGDGI